MMDIVEFRSRYGPWAVVAGASEGLGAAYAAELARRGLNLVLIARRSSLLHSIADRLAERYSVKAWAVVLDLATPNAAEKIFQRIAELEVGLLVYNAAFSAIGPFLDRTRDDHLREVDTNIRTPLKLVHLFGGQMLKRRRGGIVLMASLSAFQGSPYISTYAATKAFNIVLAEGLWEEWRSQGVDILACVAGAVRTPNYLASRPRATGRFSDSTLEPEQIPGEALGALGRRPYFIPGRMNRISSFVMRHLLPRKMTVQMMGKILHDMYIG